MPTFEETTTGQIQNFEIIRGNDEAGEFKIEMKDARTDATNLGKLVFDTPLEDDNYTVFFINPRYNVLHVMSGGQDKDRYGFNLGNDDSRLGEVGTFFGQWWIKKHQTQQE